jgi:acyl dehydratase
VKFPHPVFHGDTISVVSTVKAARESRSRPDAGIVEFEHVATNQDGVVVATCLRQVLLQKRPADTAGA